MSDGLGLTVCVSFLTIWHLGPYRLNPDMSRKHFSGFDFTSFNKSSRARRESVLILITITCAYIDTSDTSNLAIMNRRKTKS